MMGKGVYAGYQNFRLLPPCFLPFPKQTLIIQSHLFCSLQML